VQEDLRVELGAARFVEARLWRGVSSPARGVRLFSITAAYWKASSNSRGVRPSRGVIGGAEPRRDEPSSESDPPSLDEEGSGEKPSRGVAKERAVGGRTE